MSKTITYGSSFLHLLSAIDLIKNKQVQALIGTFTIQEAALVTEINNSTKKFPFISLASPATSLLAVPHDQSPFYFQMADDSIFHMQCIAALVGHFQWRKVTAIYEDNGLFSTITHLSDSLRVVNSEIEHHVDFPSLSSLSDPKTIIEEELRRLRSKSNRVFIVVQFRFESAILLFEKARQMGMMENGYVWIVADGISSLLDSVDSSVKNNMQGVIGIKTSFPEKSKAFRHFKTKFRRMYGLQYPEEEEYSNPSIFAVRAHDAITAISQTTMRKFQGNFTSKDIAETISSSDFRGLSGKIRFKNGLLSQLPSFEIINVVGKSYKELAFWSPGFGFSENLVEHDHDVKAGMDDNNGIRRNGIRGPIYWPGGLQTVPKGRTWVVTESPLKIGVPARGAFNQFVSVKYDQDRNHTFVSGFSVDVFEAVIRRLPYQLYYVFVPFNGSYDDMVNHVYYKVEIPLGLSSLANKA